MNILLRAVVAATLLGCGLTNVVCAAPSEELATAEAPKPMDPNAPITPELAGWRGMITVNDFERLNNMWDIKNGALKEAEAAILAKEENAVAAATSTSIVLDAVPTLLRESDVLGNYSCRVTKIGGQFIQLIQYPYFRCKIHQGPDGSLVIKKLSGSQRFIGRLWLAEDETSFVYLGTTYVNDDQPVAYNLTPSENQVGRLYRLGRDWLRLELPKPYYESNFDVVELVRRK